MKWCFMFLFLSLSGLAMAGKLGTFSMEYQCVWDHNGCYNGDEYVIDIRTGVQKSFDEAGECERNPDVCTEESRLLAEIINVNSNGVRFKTDADFAKMIADGEKNPERRPEYFIPLGLTDKEQIAALATASLGLIILGDGDEKVREFVQNNRNEITDTIDETGYVVGREGLAAVTLGSYFLGAVMKNGKLKEVGLISVTAGLASQVITEAFKTGFGRKRPNVANGPYDFFNEGEKSFFSGHASGTWAVATAFAELYKDEWAGVPYLAYGVAALVSYGRMNADKHWMSDITIGALVGYLTAKLTIRVFEGDDSNGGVVISPGYDQTTGAYNIKFSWSGSRPNTNELDCSEFRDMPDRVRISACNRKLFERDYDDRSFLKKLVDGAL